MKPFPVILVLILMDLGAGALAMKLIPDTYHADQWLHLIVMVAGNALALFGYPVLSAKPATLADTVDMKASKR